MVNDGSSLVNYDWLVVYLPFWNMMEFVIWDDDIPKYDGKNKVHVPKHQSVIHLFCTHIHMHHGQFHTHTHSYLYIYIIFIYNVYMQAIFHNSRTWNNWNTAYFLEGLSHDNLMTFTSCFIGNSIVTSWQIIWAHYNNSLTWNVGPFGDDSSC